VSDARLRELERAASQGDHEAIAALVRKRCQRGLGHTWPDPSPVDFTWSQPFVAAPILLTLKIESGNVIRRELAHPLGGFMWQAAQGVIADRVRCLGGCGRYRAYWLREFHFDGNPPSARVIVSDGTRAWVQAWGDEIEWTQGEIT
jgi:hypothetical protein